MNFNTFSNNLSLLKSKPLGGQSSQFKMVPKLRLNFSEEDIIKQNPKKAAVLALFYPDKDNQTRFILTERASYKGTHSSQISFPGGKKDISDVNLQQTALRETYEEIGVTDINIIRELTTTYIPPSNFLVSPFLAIINQQPNFKKNYEVATIIEVLVDDLLNDNNIALKKITTSYMRNTNVPYFKLNNYTVWGATAMILSEIKDLIK